MCHTSHPEHLCFHDMKALSSIEVMSANFESKPRAGWRETGVGVSGHCSFQRPRNNVVSAKISTRFPSCKSVSCFQSAARCSFHQYFQSAAIQDTNNTLLGGWDDARGKFFHRKGLFKSYKLWSTHTPHQKMKTPEIIMLSMLRDAIRPPPKWDSSTSPGGDPFPLKVNPPGAKHGTRGVLHFFLRSRFTPLSCYQPEKVMGGGNTVWGGVNPGWCRILLTS